MNFFTEIFQRFSGKAEPTKVRVESDIKFSALIQSIHKDIIASNQSLDCVGIKYIEQFFDKEPEFKPGIDQVLNHQFDAIEKVLDAGDTHTANQLLLVLKADVNNLKISTKGKTSNYRPKMTSFEMPVFKNGVWSEEAVTIPLLALSPMPIPKIKELTFTSTLQNIQHEGEDVYVRILNDSDASTKSKKKKGQLQPEAATEVKILFRPEQSSAELSDVIKHYEQLLRLN